MDLEGSSLKRGVLSDLEYAIELGNKSPAHDVRTGTPFFMACEVLAHRYLDFNRARVGLLWTPPPFYYNRLHGLPFIFIPILTNRYSRTANVDIESFWWLCIWCVTYFCEKGKFPTEQQLHEVTTTLFPMRGDAYSTRHMVLQDFIYDLHGLPEPGALGILYNWRGVLHDLYQRAEGADGKINEHATKNAVKEIRHFVHDLYWQVNDVPVEMIPSRITLSHQ